MYIFFAKICLQYLKAFGMADLRKEERAFCSRARLQQKVLLRSFYSVILIFMHDRLMTLLFMFGKQ